MNVRLFNTLVRTEPQWYTLYPVNHWGGLINVYLDSESGISQQVRVCTPYITIMLVFYTSSSLIYPCYIMHQEPPAVYPELYASSPGL